MCTGILLLFRRGAIKLNGNQMLDKIPIGHRFTISRAVCCHFRMEDRDYIKVYQRYMLKMIAMLYEIEMGI